MLQWPRTRLVGDLRVRVEHLVEPLRRGLAFLAHRQHPPDGVHRPDQHEDVVHERDQAADGQPALHHVQPAEQKHGGQRQVGQEVDGGPQRRPGPDPFEARGADQARLVLVALLHQRHPSERLDDPDARGHLFDGRGHVAGQVLQPARDDLVLVVKRVAEDRDRDHEQEDHQREL